MYEYDYQNKFSIDAFILQIHKYSCVVCSDCVQDHQDRRYRVFIKYCVFFRIFENIPESDLSLFSLGVSVCIHTRQVENQRCSRTGRVQKNHKILRKNTIFNEHPVPTSFGPDTV